MKALSHLRTRKNSDEFRRQHKFSWERWHGDDGVAIFWRLTTGNFVTQAFAVLAEDDFRKKPPKYYA
jgi:hypothetical protein